MTNNPTIDGVSRELLETVVSTCSFTLPEIVYQELRALLDTPSDDLREHCKQCAEVVKTWPEWKQNCLGGAPAVERQETPFPGYPPIPDDRKIPPPEVAALQSTIAQLQARVAELESGRGEPVAWIKPDVAKTLRKDECCYAFGEQNPKGTLIPLFTPPPAPVAVLHPFAEKIISKLRRFEECASDFEADGVDIGRHWLDLLTQLGLLNRVQRSPALWEITQQGEDCLDATAALNGERK